MGGGEGIKPKKGGGNKPWDYMFESWKVYGIDFPERKNCVCIDTHAKLNNWVKEQRQKFKDGTLSKDRFRQLKDNEFCFAPRKINDVANVDEVTKDDVYMKKVGEAVPPPKRKVTKDDVDVRKVGVGVPPPKNKR
jgi:hypothetical protein